MGAVAAGVRDLQGRADRREQVGASAPGDGLRETVPRRSDCRALRIRGSTSVSSFQTRLPTSTTSAIVPAPLSAARAAVVQRRDLRAGERHRQVACGPLQLGLVQQIVVDLDRDDDG